MTRALSYLKTQSLRSLLYASALVSVFALAIGILIYSLFFLARLIDSLNVSIEEEPVPVSEFNLSEFALISRKLGITLPVEEIRRPSPPPPPPEVATETPAVLEPQPAPETTTSPVSATATDPSEVALQILNGTNIPGLAKAWEGKFTDAGFQSISIGNAARQDYSGVEITTRPSKKEILPAIREVLVRFGVSEKEISEIEGNEEAEYDVVIILGR